MKNFDQLCAACRICGVKYFTLLPRVWQKELNLSRKKDEGKTDRKNRYKSEAVKFFPYVKGTLNTSDALCMLKFLENKLRFDSEWVEARIKNQA